MKDRPKQNEGMEQIMKIQSTHSRQGNLYRNNAAVFVNASLTFPRYNEENLACLTNEVRTF